MKSVRVFVLLMTCSVLGAQVPVVPIAGTGDLGKARVFTSGQGAAHTFANGGQSRDMVHALLATGEGVSIHESEQPQGAKPNAPHTISHSEFIFVREGTLAFEHDGLAETAGPGSVIYVAHGTLHTVRNIGDGPAKYVVLAIGGDQKK